jgi:4-hydroxybenzoate polyprenyltransferase
MAAAQQSSLWIPVTGFVCGIIAAIMVVFMLGQSQMYPLWTVIMMAIVGVFSFLYGINDVRDRLE